MNKENQISNETLMSLFQYMGGDADRRILFLDKTEKGFVLSEAQFRSTFFIPSQDIIDEAVKTKGLTKVYHQTNSPDNRRRSIIYEIMYHHGYPTTVTGGKHHYLSIVYMEISHD